MGRDDDDMGVVIVEDDLDSSIGMTVSIGGAGVGCLSGSVDNGIDGVGVDGTSL